MLARTTDESPSFIRFDKIFFTSSRIRDSGSISPSLTKAFIDNILIRELVVRNYDLDDFEGCEIPTD